MGFSFWGALIVDEGGSQALRRERRRARAQTRNCWVRRVTGKVRTTTTCPKLYRALVAATQSSNSPHAKTHPSMTTLDVGNAANPFHGVIGANNQPTAATPAMALTTSRSALRILFVREGRTDPA